MALTAEDIERERASQEAWLNSTAQIYPRVMTIDSTGGVVPSWQTASAVEACRITVERNGYLFGSRTELHGGVRMEQLAEWMITLRHDAVIAVGDELVIEGRKLRVTMILTPMASRTALRLRAEG